MNTTTEPPKTKMYVVLCNLHREHPQNASMYVGGVYDSEQKACRKCINDNWSALLNALKKRGWAGAAIENEFRNAPEDTVAHHYFLCAKYAELWASGNLDRRQLVWCTIESHELA